MNLVGVYSKIFKVAFVTGISLMTSSVTHASAGLAVARANLQQSWLRLPTATIPSPIQIDSSLDSPLIMAGHQPRRVNAPKGPTGGAAGTRWKA